MRHAHLAHSTVQAAISSAQHQLNLVAKGGWAEGGANGEVGGVMENGERKENGRDSWSQKGELFGNFVSNLLVILKATEEEGETNSSFNTSLIRYVTSLCQC